MKVAMQNVFWPLVLFNLFVSLVWGPNLVVFWIDLWLYIQVLLLVVRKRNMMLVMEAKSSLCISKSRAGSLLTHTDTDMIFYILYFNYKFCVPYWPFLKYSKNGL